LEVVFLRLLDELAKLATPQVPVDPAQRQCKDCYWSDYTGKYCKQNNTRKELVRNEAPYCTSYRVASPVEDVATTEAVQEVEVKTDAVSAAVALVKNAVDANKASTDLVKSATDTVTVAVASTKTAVDAAKTEIEGVQVAVASVDAKTDLVKAAIDANKNSTDLVKVAVDTLKTATDAVKAAADQIKTAVDAAKALTNIGTAGGDNILIDKLTQGAVKPSYRNLINQGESPTFHAVTGASRVGKFFPRGDYGYLYFVTVYVKNTTGAAGHHVTVSVSPTPDVAPIATVTEEVSATTEFYPHYVDVYKFWKYNSLFVSVYTDSADVQLAYDTGAPWDNFYSNDAGATFLSVSSNDPRRYWFVPFVDMASVGELPIAGTVNNIPLPNAISVHQATSIAVVAQQSAYLPLIVGAGKTIMVHFQIMGSPTSLANLAPKILCDGVQVLPFSTALSSWYANYIGSGGTEIRIGAWNTSANYYSLVVSVKYPFKRSLQVGWYNGHATDTLYGHVAVSAELIS
jgi:hypothetical protein